MGPITAPRPATSPAFRSNHRGSEKGTWYLVPAISAFSQGTSNYACLCFWGFIKHTLGLEFMFYVDFSPSSQTVANIDAFIWSKNQHSFSSQLAAELS